MGKIVETIINRFDGGIINDPRDPRENTARMVTNFDLLTNPRKLTPYRDSESGDSSASTSQKQNFELAIRTGTTWKLYGLGVQSGAATAEVLMKSITTGGTQDLGDATWETPANNQSGSGSTAFSLFTYYKKTGLIYGARAGRYIWAFDPTSSAAWDDTSVDLGGYTDINGYTKDPVGLVHSKDDIFYLGFDNSIIANNAGTWTPTGDVVALTLPSDLYITSLSEYGNFLAIACAPLSGNGNSRLFLWDRDSSLTTLSESIDLGEGVVKIIEEVNGYLNIIMLRGGGDTTFEDRVIFKVLSGNQAVKVHEMIGTSVTLPIAKQKYNNRLAFMMRGTFAGAVREGVWSFGRLPTGQYSLTHERTPNNDTALTSGILYNFIYVGDFLFQSYNSSNTFALSKTNDTASYTASGIYETKIFGGSDKDNNPSLRKKLVGVSVMTEYLPTAGQIVLKYKIDNETSWSTIFTETTDNSISYSLPFSSGTFPSRYKEIQFRIESTGGAEVTGLTFKEEIIGERNYA